MRRMIPKLILVPVDFSANSEQALDYACALASKLGSTVRLVHAFASPPSGLRVALKEDVLQNLLNEHREALGKLAAARSGSASFGEPIDDGQRRRGRHPAGAVPGPRRAGEARGVSAAAGAPEDRGRRGAWEDRGRPGAGGRVGA
jgi:hypothetical protein